MSANEEQEEEETASTTFASLCAEVDLDVRLRKAVARLGFIRPTLVQSFCLRLALLNGKDLLVRARTGSGKTLAYCLPLLNKILKATRGESSSSPCSSIKAVILVPTRELCEQVHATLRSLIYYCEELITIAVLGATSASKNSSNSSNRAFLVAQEAMLRDNPNILVATPAGLLRYLKPDKISLHQVESLVVDEADLILSFGYSSSEMEEINKKLPNIYQGYLMSATLSQDVISLKKILLHSPAILKLEEAEGDDAGGKKRLLQQYYLTIPKNDKQLVIYVFLKLGLLKGKGIFFVSTTDGGYRLKLFLEQFHIRSAVLNAELPLLSRLSIIDQFNAGNFDYLIATDESTVATSKKKAEELGEEDSNKKKQKKKIKDDHYGVSRGVDFQGVSFVVNVDFPTSADSYTHRIGRTARGDGAKGVALSLVESESNEQQQLLAAVQASQPPSVGEDAKNPPVPLDFDLREIEGFRYRVEDVRRAVTSIAVKEARAAELKAQLLNSESLQSHFAFNTTDLQLLRHDREATHVTRIQDHLRHVPKYLLPSGMQVAEMSKSKKRKRRHNPTSSSKSTASSHSNKGNDPLKKSFDANKNNNITLDGIADVSAITSEEVVKAELSSKPPDKKLYLDTDDTLGQSISGRNAWKQRHKKGQFSKKKRKKDPNGF